ncbi:MAG: sigma-E processing peptidase SpoIIGA [Acutalibacteraceae bacterium]
MRTVYVDVLIGLNVFINYFILLAVAKITRCKKSVKRFIFSSVLAGLFSLIIFLPETNFILSALIKIFISALIVIVGFKIKCLKNFFLLCSVYFGISFLYAGTMFFIWICTSYSGIMINNSVVYIDISPTVFMISVIVSYAAVSLVKRVFHFEIDQKNISEITLEFQNRTVKGKCLYDTGNMLSDAFCDAPVIIIDNSISLELCGYGFEALKNPEIIGDRLSIRIIPCSTVNKTGLLFGYKIDRACTVIGDKKYTAHSVIAAVSEEKLKGGCNVVIGTSFIKDCEEDNYVFTADTTN